jgi:hypothetical protein
VVIADLAQRKNLHLQVAFLDREARPYDIHEVALTDGRRSTSATRTSNARAPTFAGWPSISRRRPARSNANLSNLISPARFIFASTEGRKSPFAATGGGGNAGEAGGAGGAANSTATATNVATGASSANATANGGGADPTSTNAAGGAATALANATGGAASASATANGSEGRGTGLGGTALATAEGSGTSGSLLSHAASREASTQLITNLLATGSAPVDGASESESSAKYTGAAPTLVTDVQSISQLVGDPSAVAMRFSTPIPSSRRGSARRRASTRSASGGSYTPSGTGGKVSVSSVSFTLNEADLLSGKSLELGLYNGHEVDASGVTGISLTVTGNGTNLLSSPINSASQFTNDSINLGSLGTSGTLDVALTLTVHTDAQGAGFFADFLLGDPPRHAFASTHSLHPASAEHAHSLLGSPAVGAGWTGAVGHGPGPG